jgi:hypothetical protein
MAFESISAYINPIEEGFLKKESARSIAQRLGIPEKWQTIHRYKVAVWDLKDLVAEGKEIRAASHDAKHNEAVQEIVDTLEVINLGKLRAKQLLSVSLGEEFDTCEGKHKLTMGSASIYWPIGTRMLSDVVKLEMELGGDDPESRKADAIGKLAEVKINDILTEYYGCEPNKSNQGPDTESDRIRQPVHPTQTDSEASGISDQPQA